MMILFYILVLYLCFRAKQVICDFFLQTGWMAHAKELIDQPEGKKALAMHAGIHAAFTFMLVVIFAPKLWWLGIADFFIHGTIDWYKSKLKREHGWTAKDREYWWAFGLDQEAHNVTHALYIVLIVLSWDLSALTAAAQ